MLNKKLILPVFSLLLFLSSCGVVNVHSDYDRKTNFAEYKTYKFHQKGIDKLEVNDLDKRRLIQSIETELNKKGLQKTSTNADLVVNLLTSSKEQVDINQNPWFWGFGSFWGNNFTSVSQYTSGTIIIDLIDDKRNILVWQGSGSGLNVTNLDKKADRIPQAIEEILAKYPPKISSK